LRLRCWRRIYDPIPARISAAAGPNSGCLSVRAPWPLRKARRPYVVHTSYEDGNPESSVMYVWQHEKTGALHHELAYQQAVPFETAVRLGAGACADPRSSASM
jgi:hypothetical protein